MNRKELASVVAENLESQVGMTNDIVNEVFEVIEASLLEGEGVEIYGFGKFQLVDRKARTGRNPATGESIKIKATKAVKFSLTPKLKIAIKEEFTE